MKLLILIILPLFLFVSSCSSVNYVYKKRINKILPKDANAWDLEECNKILNFYSSHNSVNEIGIANQKVSIIALLLNKISIKAIARKEVIEKRLDDKEYYSILETYLNEFTSLEYNNRRKEIVEKDKDFTKGYSFKLLFENISDPYQPILLEDGYSYFFLENMNGEFSRVIEVSGLFVEDYFQLDGYLEAIITFSPFSTIGKRLFEEKNLTESYRMIFNGLQEKPIIIKWILD